MKVLNKLAAVVLAGVFAVGCSDSTGTDVLTMQDMEGTWVATKFEYTDPAGNFPTFDITSVGGALSLTVTATSATDGTYTGSLLIPPSTTPVTIGGAVELLANGTQFTLTNPTDPPNILLLNITPSGTPPTLVTLSADTNIEFDWGLGTDVPASLEIVLQKQ